MSLPQENYKKIWIFEEFDLSVNEITKDDLVNTGDDNLVSAGYKEKIEIKLSDINYSFKDKDIFKNLNMKISTNSFISILENLGLQSTLLNIIRSL